MKITKRYLLEKDVVLEIIKYPNKGTVTVEIRPRKKDEDL